MRRLILCLLVLAVMVSMAAADVAFLAGAYHERSETSAALGVRIEFNGLPDALKVVGMYAVVPALTTDGTGSQIAFDQLNMRLGPGVALGGGASTIHVAVCWQLSINKADLLNPGVFVAAVF